jgi:hypothetical protein
VWLMIGGWRGILIRRGCWGVDDVVGKGTVGYLRDRIRRLPTLELASFEIFLLYVVHVISLCLVVD